MEDNEEAVYELLAKLRFSKLHKATREAVKAHLESTGLSDLEIIARLEAHDFAYEEPAPSQSQFYDYQKTGFQEYDADTAPVLVHLQDGTLWRRSGTLTPLETRALTAIGLRNATFDFKQIFPTIH